MTRAGYLTAYNADEPDLSRPVELWPETAAAPRIHRKRVGLQ